MALHYDYSGLMHNSALTYPDNTRVEYSPDGFGRATQVARYIPNPNTAAGEPEFIPDPASPAFASAIDYYSNGLLKSFDYGNGVKHSTTRNTQSWLPERLSDCVANCGSSGASYAVDLTYGFDENLNVTRITDAVDSRYSLSLLSYDGLDRLTGATGGTEIGSSSVSYDSLGNITLFSSKNRTLDYTYDYAKNRLTSVSSSGADARAYGSFVYDARGNVLFNGHRQFAYNRANQLVSSQGNGYWYDGFNRRVKQQDADGTSYSMYSLDGVLVYRQTDAGGVNYIYLGDKLIAKDGYFADTPNPTQHHRPFGSSLEGENNDVGYTGHKFDKDLGLSYMQARYYDPVLGRFYSNDPVGYTSENPVMSFNRYLYVNNNPYKYTDPNGEFLNFAVKFATDVALGAAINYATTGSVNLGGAIKESAQGILNPAKSFAKGQKLLKLYRGGAHGKVRSVRGNESHHMPADSVSPIPKNQGPAISMDKSDHRQTASWGNSKEAKAYRAQQKELIDNGQFKQAQQMDINDVQSKFGTKYDSAIKEMQDYTDKLDQ